MEGRTGTGEGKEKADGVTFEIDSLEEMCDLMCDNRVPDNDLISRQDAVNEIHKYFVEEIDKTPTKIDEDGDELYTDMPTVNSLLACNKELSKRIKSLPSAEPKTGKWIKDNIHSKIYRYACSECKAHHRARYDFCPSCGADMRSEAREYLEYGKEIAKGIAQGLRGDSDGNK